MSKHTKGPWKIDGGKGKKGELYVWNNLNEPKGTLGSLEVCVATINAGRISPETVKANAALILAAPELLAALKKMWEWQTTVQELLPDGLANEVQGALTKAGQLDLPQLFMRAVKQMRQEDSGKTHGCHGCGEERVPRIVAGRLTCPDCGSENIVCIE